MTRLEEADLDACETAIRHGSLSFHAASLLLPKQVRRSALALYAFCRLADDAVDLNEEKAEAVVRLNERLELAYCGRPLDTAIDRAFARMIDTYDMPRALPDALLEGFAWDAMGRTYDTLSDVTAYSARVASAVGVMMAVLMRVRDRDALARACDLGVAMQLTNIARDVGEDAAEGRLYLPIEWMKADGIDPAVFLSDPRPDPSIERMVARLLQQANKLYARSEAGISELPAGCRPGIYAARFIYAGIGGRLRASGFDALSARARTSKAQKIGWLGLSMVRTAVSLVAPQSPTLYSKPLPEVAFLVDAAAQSDRKQGRSHAVIDALATLEMTRRQRKAGMGGVAARTGG